ncbi:MAG: hypothetical protein AAGA69_02185 [Pseudomonadota bacterium]
MHETRRTLKDRDRENRLYNPALEGHRHPLFASVLPHIEIVTFLVIMLLSGVAAIIFGHAAIGILISIFSSALLAMAGWVRLNDPAKKSR